MFNTDLHVGSKPLVPGKVHRMDDVEIRYEVLSSSVAERKSYLCKSKAVMDNTIVAKKPRGGELYVDTERTK